MAKPIEIVGGREVVAVKWGGKKGYFCSDCVFSIEGYCKPYKCHGGQRPEGYSVVYIEPRKKDHRNE